jgi:hypothetical protein
LSRFLIVGLQRLKTFYSQNLNGVKTMQNFWLISKLLRFFLISKLFRKVLKVCFKKDIGKTSVQDWSLSCSLPLTLKSF